MNKEQVQAALEAVQGYVKSEHKWKREVAADVFEMHVETIIAALEAMVGDANIEQYRKEAHNFVGMEYTPFGKCILPGDFNQGQAYLQRLGKMMFHLLNITAQPPKGKDDEI